MRDWRRFALLAVALAGTGPGVVAPQMPAILSSLGPRECRVLGPIISLVADSAPRALGSTATIAALLAVFALGAHVPTVNDRDALRMPMNLGALSGGMAYGFMESALVAVFPALALIHFRIPAEHGLLVVI